MMDFPTSLTLFELEGQLEDSSAAGTAFVGFGRTQPRVRLPSQGAAVISTESLPPAISANWTKLQSSRLSQRFYARLLRLASDRFHVATARSSERLRPSSLADFLDVWSKIRSEAVEPEISLSSDGSLTAEWFKSSEERLDIKFAQTAVMFGLMNKGHILEGAENKELVAMILLSHSAKPLLWRAES